jgi:hypothetical protein
MLMLNARFGRLTVVEFDHYSYHNVRRTKDREKKWICVCDCGNTVSVKQRLLIRNDTKSCGCYARERQKETLWKANLAKSRVIEYNGEKKSLIEWGKELGRSPNTINERLKRGWTIEQALEIPLTRKKNFVYFRGLKRNLRDISNSIGIAIPTLRGRIKNGWTDEDIVNTPMMTSYSSKHRKSNVSSKNIEGR